MDRFEFQLAMLQKGAEELEKKIANFTTILMQLKTVAITIWIALIGWVFTSKIDALVPLGYVREHPSFAMSINTEIIALPS